MSLRSENFIPKTLETYDERLLERRMMTEGNVCGCLLKDVEFYDNCGLEVDDFITRHGRILFVIAQQLYDKGMKQLDEITYYSSLRPEFITEIESTVGGFQQIYNMMEVVATKNWDGYLDELLKSNALLELYKKGFSIFSEITLNNGKRVIPFEFFKELTSQEVLEFYEGTIASIQTKAKNAKFIEEGYIEFDDSWIRGLKNKEEMGVSYGEAGVDIDGNEIRTFPFMSANTLGFKPGTLSGFGSLSGTGKTTYMVTTAMSLVSKGEKVVMVTNESQIGDLKAIFLAWVVFRVFKYEKLSKRKILSGEFTEEDMDIIKKSKNFWKQNYANKIKIISLSDADATLSCQLIRQAILREGASVFIVDTMKMTLSDDLQDSTWVSLIKDVRSLTELAMRYNVIGLITLQLAPSTANRAWLDVSCLANCKQIKETLSNLILFRKLYQPELDPSSPFYIRPFRKKQNENGEWYDEPYDADPTKFYIIAFTDKTRRGIDSGVDGTAFLCRTDLDHASFFETARCYPSRRFFASEDRAR